MVLVNKPNAIEDAPSASYGSIYSSETIVAGSDERSALLEPSNANDGNISANRYRGKVLSTEYLIAMVLVGVILLLQMKHPNDALSNMLPSRDDEDYYDTLDYPATFLLDQAFDSKALYYNEQKIDHFDKYEEELLLLPRQQTYSQRYYKRSKHFGGPGSPILLIMGGEAALELPMLYPFVNEGLASTFNAFVVSPEHRFYGVSQPVGNGYPSVLEMMDYLSPDQALEDAIQLIGFVRNELGCHVDKTHPDYCPVITFGGSYPGFLSGMLRFRYPEIIDGSYASSAPLELYSQEVKSSAYFDKITSVADEVSEGCSDAVRSNLYKVREELYLEFWDQSDNDNDDDDDNRNAMLEAAKRVGFCPTSFPSYIQDIEEFVSETIQYLVPAIFADFNMGYYPPGPEKALSRACAIFQETNRTTLAMDTIRNFFALRNEVEYGNNKNNNNDDNDNNKSTTSDDTCFDVSLEIPAGPNARIRGSDNSGSGGGPMGRIWEFQCCKDLIVKAGYSEESMFLPRPFSYEWHEENCLRRFPGMAMDPYRLKDEWGFSNLGNTSRIVFANGLRDGWSAASITEVSNVERHHEVSVINFPNGAHHSELKSGPYPNPNETADILDGYETVTEILSGWLDEIASARITEEHHL